MHYLIFLFLLFSIPIIIGLLTSKLIYNYIKEKTSNKYYKLLALIPVLLVGYFYSELFFLSNSFYKNKFEEITNIELPNDSNIIYKDSSFLGETILFTTEVPTPFYNSTLSEFIEKGYQEKVLKINDIQSNSSNSNKGFGNKLLDLIETIAKQNKCYKIIRELSWVDARTHQDRLHSFYTKKGYSIKYRENRNRKTMCLLWE